MSRVETQGRTPRGAGPWMVEFRSGFVSGPFAPEQIRWSDTGHAWDAVAVLPADKGAEQSTWNPKAGGY